MDGLQTARESMKRAAGPIFQSFRAFSLSCRAVHERRSVVILAWSQSSPTFHTTLGIRSCDVRAHQKENTELTPRPRMIMVVSRCSLNMIYVSTSCVYDCLSPSKKIFHPETFPSESWWIFQWCYVCRRYRPHTQPYIERHCDPFHSPE